MPAGAANCYHCSAFMAIDQWVFFNVPTVYNSHLRGPLTLTLLSSDYQWSCHYLYLWRIIKYVMVWIRTTNLPYARQTLWPSTHALRQVWVKSAPRFCKKKVLKFRQCTFRYFVITPSIKGWTKSPFPKDALYKVWLNWYSDSGKKIETVNWIHTRRTTGDQKSWGKPRWKKSLGLELL